MLLQIETQPVFNKSREF